MPGSWPRRVSSYSLACRAGSFQKSPRQREKPSPVSQIYLLLSCCPCEGRISGIVDVPNACCTLAIPIAIFDQVRSRQGRT